MSANPIYMSAQQFEELNMQIQELEERLAEAKAARDVAKQQGDRSENSEYEDAINAITGLSTQLKELYYKKDNVQILNNSNSKASSIQLGREFSIKIDGTLYEHLRLIDDGTEVKPYKTVSIGSKLGILLVGRRLNEEFEYTDNILRTHTVKIMGIQ